MVSETSGVRRESEVDKPKGRSIRFALTWLSALCAFTVACTPEVQSASWLFTYGDEASQLATKGVRAQIWRGGCDEQGDERTLVFESWFNDGQGAPPETLKKGTYAFEGAAVDGLCRPIALGCTTVELPLRDSATVVVSLERPPMPLGALCLANQCDDGLCRNGNVEPPSEMNDASVPMDGAVTMDSGDVMDGSDPMDADAPMDADVPMDADTPMDAEPPMDADTPMDAEPPMDAEVPPSCQEIFAGAPNTQVCRESATACEMSAQTAIMIGQGLVPGTCDAFCRRYGTVCLAAYDNAVLEAPCDRLGVDECDDKKNSEICVCARP